MEILMIPIYKHSFQHDAKMYQTAKNHNKVIRTWVHSFQLAMALKTFEFTLFFLRTVRKDGQQFFWSRVGKKILDTEVNRINLRRIGCFEIVFTLFCFSEPRGLVSKHYLHYIWVMYIVFQSGAISSFDWDIDFWNSFSLWVVSIYAFFLTYDNRSSNIPW